MTGGTPKLLLRTLPPIVHLERSRTRRRALVDRADDAGVARAAARARLVAQHLAHMMLVQALRLHLSDGPAERRGWLFALADQQIGAAIAAMHDDPAHPGRCRSWPARPACRDRLRRGVPGDGRGDADRLSDPLADAAGGRRLRTPAIPLAIASSLGYESENTFNTAFKRVMGSRHGATPAPKAGRPDPTEGASAGHGNR